jgi:predicted metal-dependent hydrolase
LSALSRTIPKKKYIDAGTETVASAEGEIVYALRRSRRRTVGISVHPDRSIVVRAPLRVSRETIRDFVRSHADWIERTRLRLAERPPKAAPPGYGSGETHRFLGQPYRLVVSRGPADSVELVVGCLCVKSRIDPSPARVKALLERWYREQAEVVFSERLAACHSAMTVAGIPYPALRIRKMTSRWGSCSTASGRINLNLWLVKAPVDCIDYVLIHELCHFKVRSHGPRFWKTVAGFLPDYAERRKRLNADWG